LTHCGRRRPVLPSLRVLRMGLFDVLIATIGWRGKDKIMARQKPLHPAIVDEWLAAWESDPFSDAAVRHLQSLITDPFCFVVVTLGVGREPRSLVFRRVKRMLPRVRPKPKPKYLRRVQDMFGGRTSREALLRDRREQIELFRSMPVGPVAPVAPSVGQLWHQTGV
jgi:hypothetical protein